MHLSEQLSSLVGRMTVGEVKEAFLVFSKSNLCSGSHTHGVSFCRSCLKWLVRHAVSGANAPNSATRPRNERSSLTFPGCWKLRKAANLSLSGRMPPSEMMCPAKCMLLPISNFFLEMVILFASQRLRTVVTRSSSCFSSPAQIIVSSTIFMA